MKLTQGKPARSAALVGRKVSVKISVCGHTSVLTVGLCSTAITMLRSIFLTEGSDGAHVKLLLRVRSEKLLREAPAFMRGESSRKRLCVEYYVKRKNFKREGKLSAAPI